MFSIFMGDKHSVSLKLSDGKIIKLVDLDSMTAPAAPVDYMVASGHKVGTGTFKGINNEGGDYSYAEIVDDNGKEYSFMLTSDFAGSKHFADGNNVGKRVSFEWKNEKDMTYGGEMEIEKLLRVSLVNE